MRSRLFVLLLMSSFLGDGKADGLPQSQLELLPSSQATPEDSCDYIHGWKCGDSCLGPFDDCSCGSSGPRRSPSLHCCTLPDSKCHKAQSDSSIVVCSEGFMQPFSIPCNTTVASQRCYNSYKESLFIGPEVHYWCPGMCIPEEDMCQGISWCDSDVEICGPELRCSPPASWTSPSTNFSLNSPLLPNHHYCGGQKLAFNNKKFDTINRNDEEGILRDDGSALDIDENEFLVCLQDDSGLDCGGKTSESSLTCFPASPNFNFWCKKPGVDKNVLYSGICGNGMNTDDWRICSNPKVWAKVSCTGKRCLGNNMRCSRPWYTVVDGFFYDNCEDKSNQVKITFRDMIL